MKIAATLLILLSCVFYQTPVEAGFIKKIRNKFYKKIIPKAHLPSLGHIPSESSIVASDDPYAQCKATVLPSFINNSMSWTPPPGTKTNIDFPFGIGKTGGGNIGRDMRRGRTVYRGLDALSPPSVVVTAAGNEGSPERGSHAVSGIKTRASKNFDTIVVGSLNPYNNHSAFSQQGEAVHIMAPSDHIITSANNDGSYRKFGGTSGATPLVTSSLAGFEWLSGYHPTAKESKILLEKTAIPTQYSDDKPRKNGVGMVNAYKLGMVGKELKRLCGKNISCFKRMINNPDVYKFPEDHGIEEAVEQAFPECGESCGGVVDQQCTDKDTVFKRLRKASFLNPSNKKLWRYLACIYNTGGFTEDARAMENTYKTLFGRGEAYRVCQSDDNCTLVRTCSMVPVALSPPSDRPVAPMPYSRPVPLGSMFAMTKAEAEMYYATRKCQEQCNGKCRCSNEETVSGTSYFSQCVNSRCVLVKGEASQSSSKQDEATQEEPNQETSGSGQR